jgi:hypothetical protein
MVEVEPSRLGGLGNPTKCPSVKKDLGQQFIDWLISSSLPGTSSTGNSFSIRMQMIRMLIRMPEGVRVTVGVILQRVFFPVALAVIAAASAAVGQAGADGLHRRDGSCRFFARCD